MVSSATMKAWEPFGVCANDCTVIHNGLVDQCGGYHKTVTPAPLRIGFLGMYSDQKGFPVVQEWINSKTRAKWILYGQIGAKYNDAANRLHRKYPGVVELAGRRTCKEIFSDIDILVHPSTEFDSFPTALLEAAQFGVPAVASNSGGTCEIVQHGVTGFVYDKEKPHEGLTYVEKLASDPVMRRRIGNNARELFTRAFRAERMVDNYFRFFNETSNPACLK
jgi:glycosyltransferase involved in cell wall biosynthesis